MTGMETSEALLKHRKVSERRHFSHHLLESTEKQLTLKPHGRLYIPHSYGVELDYRPQVKHMEPHYTDCGPDWSSKLRWIPEPRYSDAPYPDIKAIKFPEEVQLMRHFPVVNRDSIKEWNFEFPSVNNLGKQCFIDGVYLANKNRMAEITLAMMVGRKRIVIDCRNGIPETTPGDKPFYTPEYSPDFHKLGSLKYFEISRRLKKITTYTLQKQNGLPSVPYSVKLKMHQLEEDRLAVINLEEWKPAPPLIISGFAKKVKEHENH